MKICVICGVKFTPPSGSNRATCSNDCATAYRKLRFEENHPGGYNNPEFKARREVDVFSFLNSF